MYKSIYLKKGKEESLKRFHPWIFSGAIHHMDGDISEGEIVRVITASGDFIAVGHYQIGSLQSEFFLLEISKLIMNFGALDLKVHLKLVRVSI